MTRKRKQQTDEAPSESVVTTPEEPKAVTEETKPAPRKIKLPSGNTRVDH